MEEDPKAHRRSSCDGSPQLTGGEVAGEVVHLNQYRHRCFRCRICRRRATRLLSVRLSEWSAMSSDYVAYTAWKERCSLRTEFICYSCFHSFRFEPGHAHGYYAYASTTFRLSIAKKPVEYDEQRWRRYARRYGGRATDVRTSSVELVQERVKLEIS